MNYFKKKIIISLVMLLFFMACSQVTKLTKTKPAEVSMEGIKALAILPFSGRYGETVRSDFYKMLSNVKHFELIDTSKANILDKIAFDQIDDPRFINEFKNLKADGVITGRVAANINDNRGYDQVAMQEGTGRYKKIKNIFGKMVNVEIMRTVLRPVAYVIRQATLTANFKVFDLRTKRVIANGKITQSYNQKFGGDKETGLLGFGASKLSHLPSKNQTLNELSLYVASKLAKKISPMSEVIEVEFESGNDLTDEGIEFAKRGLWEEAIAMWEDAVQNEPEHAPAYYNLGVAYERLADVNSLRYAKKMYKNAYKYDDDSMYLDAIARVNTAISDRQKYDHQKNLLNINKNKTNKSGTMRIY